MNLPGAEARAPAATKTTVKPSTKASDASRTCGRDDRGFTVPRLSSSVRPEMTETYPGLSGSTHGDTNERKPATNAASNVTSWDIGLLTWNPASPHFISF